MNDQNFNSSYRPPEDNRPPVDIFPGSDNNYAPRGGVDLRAAFASGLFLAMCILATLATLFGTITFSFDEGPRFSGVNIISVISTIGMWITYATASDGSRDQMSNGGVTMVSGCIKATRVIMWIVMSLLLFCGLMLILVGVLSPLVTDFTDDILNSVRVSLEGFSPEQVEEITALLDRLFADGLLALVFVAAGIGVILGAVVVLIFNLTYYRYCHRLAYSIAEMVKGRTDRLLDVRTVSTWLLVVGILSAVSSFYSLGGAVTAALYIVSSVFVKKLGADN